MTETGSLTNATVSLLQQISIALKQSSLLAPAHLISQLGDRYLELEF